MQIRLLQERAIYSCPGRMGQVDLGKVDLEKSEDRKPGSLVIGGTGLVGGYIVENLVRRGERPFALSRSQQNTPGVDWFCGDRRSRTHRTFPHLRRCIVPPTPFYSPKHCPDCSIQGCNELSPSVQPACPPSRTPRSPANGTPSENSPRPRKRSRPHASSAISAGRYCAPH